MQCRLRDRRSRLFSLGLRPCPLRTEIPPDSLNFLIMLCTVEGEISKSLPIFLWGTLFLNISIIFSRICWQTGDPRPIFAPKGLDLSWMLLLYQIIITITCWHQLFQIIFNANFIKLNGLLLENTLLLKKCGVSKINTFIQKGCIKLIKMWQLRLVQCY